MEQLIKKTIVKGLYLTADGKAWHKSSKCEIKPDLKGKVRFNGKIYDLQKLIAGLKPKATTKLKKKSGVRELQKQGFKKTRIKGLYITNTGICYNSASNRNLTPTAKGNIVINGTGYNLSKLMLETFSKIPYRTGQTVFKNGNTKDYTFDNLKYITDEPHQPPPKESDIIKIIRLYFEVPKKMNRHNILYKVHLHQIANERGFIYNHTGKDFELFIEWLTPFSIAQSQSKREISINNGYNTSNGINIINKYLSLLVNDCLKDYDNGLLSVKNFEPKPPTKTQKLKALQKVADDYGLNVKIPLRKPSGKEIINKYFKQTEFIKPPK